MVKNTDTARRMPLLLQFFAEEGDGAENGSPGGAASPTADLNDMADRLVKAIESRTQRAERATVRSLAEQYGMQESEVSALLDKARAGKAKALPEEARRQIEAAKSKAGALLLAAEVRIRGAEMGLLDPDMALLAIDRKAVKIGEDGGVEGVTDALKALRAAKPYLFGASQKPGAWGAPQGDGAGKASTAREEMKRMMFGTR